MAVNTKKRKLRKVTAKPELRLVQALVLAACMVVLGFFAFHTLAATKSGQSWIISTTALGLLNSAGATLSSTNADFNNSGTYVLGASNSQNPMPNAMPTQTFSSYATFASKVASDSLTPGIKAVLYDNEAWSFTPTDEQDDPVGYTQKFATVAHQHGLQLIAAPAVDLVSVLAPNSTTNRYQEFINLGIIGGVAKYADVTEIQAQGAENTPEYATFVQAGAEQARTANPSSKVFAGIGTAQSGNQFPASVLYSAYQSTTAYVSGYWLNVPQPHSSFCPTCPEGSPEVALSFLEMINPAPISSVTSTPAPTPTKSSIPKPTSTPEPRYTPVPSGTPIPSASSSPSPSPTVVSGAIDIAPPDLPLGAGNTLCYVDGNSSPCEINTSNLSNGDHIIEATTVGTNGSIITQKRTIIVKNHKNRLQQLVAGIQFRSTTISASVLAGLLGLLLWYINYRFSILSHFRRMRK